MAVENIEVQITADDSGFLESIEEMNTEALELDATAKDLNKSLDKAFKPRQVQSYQGALKGATGELTKQNKQVKKNTKGFAAFNKAGGRGISMLSRFGGVGGRATRSLGGLASALGGSPFGAFALAAGAATLAYSFFTKKIKEEAEAIKKSTENINELNKAIEGIDKSIKSAELDLSLLSENEKSLSVSRDLTKEIRDLIAEDRIIRKDIERISKEEIKTRAERFERQERLLELEEKQKTNRLEQLKLTKALNDESGKRADAAKKEEEKLDRQRKKASEDRRKRALQTQNLFDSLIRDELEKRLVALDKAAAARDKQAKDTISSTSLRNKFLKKSQRILEEDKQKVRKEFADAEIKARQALQLQLIQDEESISIAAAQKASEDREKQIKAIAKDKTEEANFLKLNEEKLQSDIKGIQDKFAEQRKQEGLAKEQEIFSLRSASFEAQVQQEKAQLENELLLEQQQLISTKRTEEEITAFNKEQNDKKLKQDLQFQIARLELARKYNKELTKEESAALEAQIALLKTRLKGVGAEVQAEAKTDAKNGDGLFGLLGISADTQEDVQAVIGAIQQVTQEASKAVAERVRLLDEEVQASEARISKLQGDLQTEIELNKLGKASSIKEVQDQLRQEKAARDKAEQEKEEAAKAQFTIDTALQASNLITAISGLYKSLSSLPFGIGVALATALSGVMIGSFVASKATAASAAGFAEGGQYGFTGAGSKQTKSTKLGDRPYDYHAGEYILPQSMVSEYGLDGVPIDKAGQVLGEHFSDRIPDHRNAKAANARLRESKATNTAATRQERSKVLKETFREEFASQNKILNKQLKALENMPITTELSKGVFRVQRGKNIEIIRS